MGLYFFFLIFFTNDVFLQSPLFKALENILGNRIHLFSNDRIMRSNRSVSSELSILMKYSVNPASTLCKSISLFGHPK